MDKITDFIKKHKILSVILIIGVFILPLVAVHALYKWVAPCWWLESTWGSGDLLNYYASFLSLLGTVFLGYVAIMQGRQANATNQSLLELEWKRQQPCFDITESQKYNLYIGEEIEKYKSQNDISEELRIDPRYTLEPRTGIETTVALMEIEVTNSGNTGIRKMYFQDMNFFLGTHGPVNKQRPMGFYGNTQIGIGEKKKLIIEFLQELKDDDDDGEKQLNWINIDKHLLFPYIDMTLGITSADGIDYVEKIILMSDGGNSEDKNRSVLSRRLTVQNVKIEKTSS